MIYTLSPYNMYLIFFNNPKNSNSHHKPLYPIVHPLPRRGLGRPLLFGACRPLFVKFFPFCFSIYALLPSKRRPFTLQKGIF